MKEGDDSQNDGVEEVLSSHSTHIDYATAPSPPDSGQVKCRGGITTHFPALLHAMLTRAEVDGYNDICSWNDHGRSFVVHDRDRYVQEVMPLYFRQTQFASFQRQLNLYGFHRLSPPLQPDVVAKATTTTTQDPSAAAAAVATGGVYYHPMFLRTRQDLCPAIQRPTERQSRECNNNNNNSNKTKKAKGTEPDPDFSRFPPMPPSGDEQIKLANSTTMPHRKPPPLASLGPKLHPIIQQSRQPAQQTELLLQNQKQMQPQPQVFATWATALPIGDSLLASLGLPVTKAATATPTQTLGVRAATASAATTTSYAPTVEHVNETYSSLFLSDGGGQQEEVDLSWMEPRPIAPELVPALQNSRELLVDPPNVREFIRPNNKQPFNSSSKTKANSNLKPLIQGDVPTSTPLPHAPPSTVNEPIRKSPRLVWPNGPK